MHRACSTSEAASAGVPGALLRLSSLERSKPAMLVAACVPCACDHHVSAQAASDARQRTWLAQEPLVRSHTRLMAKAAKRSTATCLPASWSAGLWQPLNSLPS